VSVLANILVWLPLGFVVVFGAYVGIGRLALGGMNRRRPEGSNPIDNFRYQQRMEERIFAAVWKPALALTVLGFVLMLFT
jgi:hypothetical protein